MVGRIRNSLAMAMTKFLDFLQILSLQKIWTQSSCFRNSRWCLWYGWWYVVTYEKST